MQALLSLLAGLVFGIGLLVSGMTDPAKVQGFLDPLGSWDPSLLFVMGAAIAVAAPAFAIARRRKRAWDGSPISLPGAGAVDPRLLLGGALFGIGWGLAGYCPGPAVVALGSGRAAALWFVPAMLAGMLLHDHVIAPLAQRAR